MKTIGIILVFVMLAIGLFLTAGSSPEVGEPNTGRFVYLSKDKLGDITLQVIKDTYTDTEYLIIKKGSTFGLQLVVMERKK